MTTSKQIAAQIGAFCLLMGLEIDAGRQALIAQHCTRYQIEARWLEDVFRYMVDDEDLSQRIRIYGTLTPSDIGAAWQAVAREKRAAEAREQAARASEARTKAWMGKAVHTTRCAAPMQGGREDNTRRLEAGTVAAGPPRTAAYLAQWNEEFYGRAYIEAMREKARADLQRETP